MEFVKSFLKRDTFIFSVILFMGAIVFPELLSLLIDHHFMFSGSSSLSSLSFIIFFVLSFYACRTTSLYYNNRVRSISETVVSYGVLTLIFNGLVYGFTGMLNHFIVLQVIILCVMIYLFARKRDSKK